MTQYDITENVQSLSYRSIHMTSFEQLYIYIYKASVNTNQIRTEWQQFTFYSLCLDQMS